MATYVNDLRLKEIATGDESGTWGTSTNTNLELIGEALGFGTEAITTNADTHTTTVADGSTDPGRAMYLKYTGTLDSACTITIAPNTISRMQFIENGTTGSQNIIISQGTGANVTIPAGDTKAVYLDGAGAGAAVVDAFASLNTVDLKVEDDLTVTDDASVGGDLLVSGEVQTANIGFTDGDNAITISDGGGTSFAQKITADAGIDIDNFNIDGTTLALSSGDFTLDVAGDIVFDAGGADIKLNDDGTAVAEINLTGGNLILNCLTSNEDFLVKGNDGGSTIDALVLDMSEAGAAIFNNTISLNGILTSNANGTGGTKATLADFTSSGSIRSILLKGAENTANQVFLDVVKDINGSETTLFSIADTSIGIGTTSPNASLDVVSDSSANGIEIRGRSADNISQLTFESNDSGTTYSQLQSLSTELKVKAIANIPMSFFTNNTESMRVTTAHKFVVGDTTALNGGGALGSFVFSGSQGVFISTVAQSTGEVMGFVHQKTSVVGTIAINSSSTAYNTSSDARLKDVTGEARGLDVINKLNPVSYNWKVDGKEDEGLIAQECEDIVPNAITKNSSDYYEMDYSKLVVHLVKGMQEQQEQIEQLKTEIQTLQ